MGWTYGECVLMLLQVLYLAKAFAVSHATYSNSNPYINCLLNYAFIAFTSYLLNCFPFDALVLLFEVACYTAHSLCWKRCGFNIYLLLSINGNVFFFCLNYSKREQDEVICCRHQHMQVTEHVTRKLRCVDSETCSYFFLPNDLVIGRKYQKLIDSI